MGFDVAKTHVSQPWPSFGPDAIFVIHRGSVGLGLIALAYNLVSTCPEHPEADHIRAGTEIFRPNGKA